MIRLLPSNSESRIWEKRWRCIVQVGQFEGVVPVSTLQDFGLEFIKKINLGCIYFRVFSVGQDDWRVCVEGC
jgi:hypothetical protein